DHRGDGIKRGGIKRHWCHRKFVMHSFRRAAETIAFRNLNLPPWQSVCSGAQVFRKKLLQLILKTATKKRPLAGAFDVWHWPRSRRVLTKRLTLRELERTAGLGAAVLLALDHAGIAGEEATLLEHAAQFRLEIGKRLGKAVTDRAGLT